jgi:hypothetical protein
MFSGFNPYKHKRDGWDSSALTDNVVELALIVGDTRTHLALERLHRKYFDSNVNMVAHVESEVLDRDADSRKKIVSASQPDPFSNACPPAGGDAGPSHLAGGLLTGKTVADPKPITLNL